LKEKKYKIFVDTLEENKVGMETMFDFIVEEYMNEPEKMRALKQKLEEKKIDWLFESEDYSNEYTQLKKAANGKKEKVLTKFNNELITEIIKEELIDIRLFGSAMAVKNLTRTYTGPIQTSWGYSLHPVELVKSNSITSMMSDDNSTFGKTHQIYYGLIAHYGTINKFSAKKTGMTEEDLEIFRKALVQSMMNNQTSSKKGQVPLSYIEICYKDDFDGYLGDLRRFIQVDYDEKKPIRSMEDLSFDFVPFEKTVTEIEKDIEKIILWKHPIIKNSDKFNIHLNNIEEIDLLENIESE
jgi:CRISPR-associated protein Csh2